MSTYVWMRILESSSHRYDVGMRILSWGRINSVYDRVAHLARGPRVLDLGCGTGAVALRLAARGLEVTGVDQSPEMLDRARQKVPGGVRLRWVEAGAVEIMDHFQPESFDAVTSVLLFSELSESEQAETLRQCHLLLRAGGQLIVAEEVRASTAPRRVLQCLVRFPAAALTYMLTQATTQAVRGLEDKVARAQFTLIRRESNGLGDFLLLEAEKKGLHNGSNTGRPL